MSAASSQVPLQRMSDSKYLEITVTPASDAVSLSNENPTTLSRNLALLLEQIFQFCERIADATRAIARKRSAV